MPTLKPVLPVSPELPDALPTDAPAAPRPRGQPANPQKFAVAVAPSHIEGRGAFAQEPIPARRKIGEIRGERVTTTEAYARARAAEHSSGHIFMVAVSARYAIDASASADPLRFANHACQPNMVLRVEQGRVAFYALRDIAPGEELTARYGPTHHRQRLACRCGAPRCQKWL